MKTTLQSTVKPLAALLLLSACNPDTSQADLANQRERIMDEAIAQDIRDIRVRLDKLEAADAVDSKNIDTLFRSRDAIRELQKIDQKYNEESFKILRENDRHINANSFRPLPVKEDE